MSQSIEQILATKKEPVKYRCAQCNVKGTSTSNRTRRFCGDHCRIAWHNENRAKILKEGKRAMGLPVEPWEKGCAKCGKVFTPVTDGGGYCDKCFAQEVAARGLTARPLPTKT